MKPYNNILNDSCHAMDTKQKLSLLLYSIFTSYYGNTPIRIFRKFLIQKTEIFQI